MADPFSKPGSNPNPYKPPSATVADVRPATAQGTLADEPRATGAGRGSSWWGEAWQLFKQAPGTWIRIVLIVFAILVVASLIPVASLVTYVLLPIFTAGIMLGCRALDQGEELEVGHLFAGFKEQTGSLALVGVLYTVSAVVVFAVVALLMLGGLGGLGLFLGGMTASDPGVERLGSMTFLLAMLLILALSIPLLMAVWFAPALVILHELSAIEAMRLSFVGCLRNTVPFLVYGVVGFLLAIGASIPLLLGWLVVGPMIFGSIYSGYKEIFLENA